MLAAASCGVLFRSGAGVARGRPGALPVGARRRLAAPAVTPPWLPVSAFPCRFCGFAAVLSRRGSRVCGGPRGRPGGRVFVSVQPRRARRSRRRLWCALRLAPSPPAARLSLRVLRPRVLALVSPSRLVGLGVRRRWVAARLSARVRLGARVRRPAVARAALFHGGPPSFTAGCAAFPAGYAAPSAPCPFVGPTCPRGFAPQRAARRVRRSSPRR